MALRLKQEIKQQIKDDVSLQGKLASYSNKSIETLKRWIRTDDEQLTNLGLLLIIKNYNNEEDINQLCEPVEITA